MCEVRSTIKACVFVPPSVEAGRDRAVGFLTPGASGGKWFLGCFPAFDLADRKLEDGAEANCETQEAMKLAWRFFVRRLSVGCGREVMDEVINCF